jgi:hypothetical protein
MALIDRVMNTVRYIEKIEYIPTKRQLSIFLVSNPEKRTIDCSVVFNDVRSFCEKMTSEDYEEPYLESCIDIRETVGGGYQHYVIVTDEREISFDAYQIPIVWQQ